MSTGEHPIARSPAGIALLAALLAAGAQIALHYSRLPLRMASHFDMAGRADGWMGKDAFLAVYAGAIVLVVGLMAGIALALPRIPDSLINLPHKDHWLAGARRGETLAWLGRWMLWEAAATVVFLSGNLQLTFAANLGGEPSLGDAFWWMFGAYMLLTLGGLTWLMLRIARPPDVAGPAGGTVARRARRSS